MSSNTKHGVRFVLTPNSQQAQNIEYYLTRSSLFWNLLLYHTDEYIKEYIEQPNSIYNDKQLERFMYLVYETLIHRERDEGIHFSARDEADIMKIRTIPNTSLRNRVHDLAKLVITYKHRFIEKGITLPGLPKRKSPKSRQSIRFDPSDYMITGDTLEILGRPGIKINIPGLSKLDFTVPKDITFNYQSARLKLANLDTHKKPNKLPFYYVTVIDKEIAI